MCRLSELTGVLRQRASFVCVGRASWQKRKSNLLGIHVYTPGQLKTSNLSLHAQVAELEKLLALQQDTFASQNHHYTNHNMHNNNNMSHSQSSEALSAQIAEESLSQLEHQVRARIHIHTHSRTHTHTLQV